MTSSTNAPRRDFSVDAGRLMSERCQRHHGAAYRPFKGKCLSCLTEALAAAYEAGRADATPKAWSCDCRPGPVAERVSCDCCHAPAGEPCRHKETP